VDRRTRAVAAIGRASRRDSGAVEMVEAETKGPGIGAPSSKEATSVSFRAPVVVSIEAAEVMNVFS
jgi:hypothetical protein